MLPRSAKSKQLYLGEKMASFLYNLAQEKYLPADWRESVEHLLRSWDELKKAANKEARSREARKRK